MRIAYIGIKGLPSEAGADRVVEAIVRRLSDRHTITVYCSRRHTARDSKISEIRLKSVPFIPGKHMHMASVNFLSAYHAVLYGNYNLIHLHNIEASFVLPILRLKYPVVATAHGFITPGSKWNKLVAYIMQSMTIPFMYLSSKVTSVSFPDSEKLRHRFNRPVSYIPNGISANPEVDIKSARELIVKNRIQEQNYIIFVAGRIIPLKGAHLLLRAIHGIKNAPMVVIVGDLSHSPEYSILLKSLANSRVRFIPFVSSSAVLFGLIKLSHLFVFPSEFEAMSMVLLEGASLGTPIVCSDIPANVSVLKENALYFRSGNVHDLRKKLLWTFNHATIIKEMGYKARMFVKEKYSWDNIADKYDKLYQSVLR